MRILQIIDSFSPAIGGPPEAVRQLIRASVAAGDQVEAVCLDDPRAEFLAGIECPVHALGQSYLGRYAFSPRLWRWLQQNAGRYDGLVMNGIWSFPGVALSFAARRAGKPYGIFTHGALDPWFNRTYPLKFLKKLLYWPMQYMVLRHARAVFFTTEAERDLAATSFKPNRWNSVVVPYGIMEPETSGVTGECEEFYGQLPELRGRRFLLFLARMHEKKGCDLLIQAFARVAQQEAGLDLVMAGPDQVGMQARLEKMAAQSGVAGRVHWPGMIGGRVKWGALRACEAVILPSHQENLGISVVESLAVGRPVLISYEVNIWREIIGDGAGLAEEDTIDGIERLLRRWLALPPVEREAMAARAQPCFAARYSMARAVAAIDCVFAARQPGNQL
jgi:glycosyltransferase involved in cell wall biosynthesis